MVKRLEDMGKQIQQTRNLQRFKRELTTADIKKIVPTALSVRFSPSPLIILPIQILDALGRIETSVRKIGVKA